MVNLADEKQFATINRGSRPLVAKLEDKDYVVAARDAGFTDSQWRALFYEVGPYDVTVPSLVMKRLVRIVLERFASDRGAE